jgi:glycosyltransferase involved in cell wall biosynthesis
MGLGDNVFLPGKVPHELLPSYYAACDIFVLPSLKEGFGIVFLEAMYHGKACIGANAGGAAEVVHDRVAGYWSTSPTFPLAFPKLSCARSRTRLSAKLWESGEGMS